MARKRNAVRAERRRVKRTLENALARERAQESAAEAQDEEWRPRVARHCDQLDFLLTLGAISDDMTKAGNRFATDFQKSMTVSGRLVGAYEADIIRRPGRWQAPPDTPRSVAARERFEAAVDALGPLWSITFHVAVTNQPPEAWGVPPERQNGDAMALLRLGLATLVQWYGRARAGQAGRSPHRSESKPAALAL